MAIIKRQQGNGENFVNVQIDGEYFGNWSECEITLAIDSYSTVSLTAPFEPSRKEFRDTFRPFKYRTLEVDADLETLFQGYMVDVDPTLGPDTGTVAVQGYAKPGVVCDSDMPVSLLTASGKKSIAREWSKLGLKAIAEDILVHFGIEVQFDGPEGKPFDKVRIGPDKKIQEFLAELAKQRNLVLSNTVDGKLRFWQSVETGKPVVRLVEGEAPLTRVEPQFNPREYYSEITGFASKKRGKVPAKWTEKNPWLTAPLRANTFKLEDTERGDAPEATQAKLGRMFANMASYTIPDLPTWRDPQGELWQPNTTLTLLAPGAMVYSEYEFLIRKVKLKSTKDGDTATLEVCMPGAFNGTVPESLPWDEAS